MVIEPAIKRCITFFDGQNLFNAAKEAFGYNHPNYDVLALSKAVCLQKGWEFTEAKFYTGMPVYEKDKKRHIFWSRKLRVMGRQGIKIFTRNVRYREETIHFARGSSFTHETSEE